MKKRLTKRKINYIKRHYHGKSYRERTQKPGISRYLVKRVRKELNLGVQEKQPSGLPYKRKPSPEGFAVRGWSRRKIAAVNLVVGVVVAGFCLYLLSQVDRSELNVILITIVTLRADHVEFYVL